MDDKSKLAFNYLSDFVKTLLSVSAGSVTFILTFSKEIMPEHPIHSIIWYMSLGIFGLALITLLLSSAFSLLAMREIIYQIVSEEHPDVLTYKIKKKIRTSVYLIYSAFILLIIFVCLSFGIIQNT